MFSIVTVSLVTISIYVPFFIFGVSVMKDASCICSCHEGLCKLSASLPEPMVLLRVDEGGGTGVERLRFRK